MRRALIFAIAMCGTIAAAAAPSFNASLEKGHAKLEGGDTEGAMTEYRNLQVDHPESLELYYNMGRAQYQAGMQEIELKAAEDAVNSFTEAKASFERAEAASDPILRRNARFNAANCSAEAGKQLVAANRYEEAVKTLEDAIDQYKKIIDDSPEDMAARLNRANVMYCLKTLMQNPPPSQEQQQGQEGDQGEQNKDQKDDQPKCNKPGEGEESKEQKRGEDQQAPTDQERQKKDQQKQEAQQQEAQAQQTQENQEQDKEQNQENAEEQKPDQQQNVEALLQSLEDTDQREQREVRNERSELGMSKEWW